MQQLKQKSKVVYEKINPEEIIFKLKTMIKILEGKNGRDERKIPLNTSN